MAKRYYGSNRGEATTSISEGSSTTSKAVEVVVDLASNLTQDDVLVKLEEIRNYILKGIWPPA